MDGLPFFSGSQKSRERQYPLHRQCGGYGESDFADLASSNLLGPDATDTSSGSERAFSICPTNIRNSNVRLETPYTCALCPYRSMIKHTIEVHMRTHTGEKPFSCPYCPKKFTVKCNLKTHIRRHKGEKPYSCSFCPYRTAHSSDLNKHIVTHKNS
ncbi:hypothetical protein SK128_023849 [Halocaridina rubra]|uniref:C2H2-type domain-containing protein n=1 Tax=Halocaridina rubra TaxID=373956 RepID=A0AAN8XEU7_HALRR